MLIGVPGREMPPTAARNVLTSMREPRSESRVTEKTSALSLFAKKSGQCDNCG